MGKFVKGEVVVLPFPFSDLTGSKKRPALVLADLEGNDILLCQITSQTASSFRSVPLVSSDFTSGSLPVDSYIRPTRIFTADKNIILRKAGQVNSQVVNTVVQRIMEILK